MVPKATSGPAARGVRTVRSPKEGFIDGHFTGLLKDRIAGRASELHVWTGMNAVLARVY